MTVTKVVIEADGGSRGNPGPAGYGAVVWNADRSAVLAERKESLGVVTNNVAEYRGLIAGLDAAAALGAREVSARMDSKLVVEQMSGRWKVKHPDMIPLHRQATLQASAFDRVEYTWIPRAENSHADRLANEAMDGKVETAPDAALAAPPARDLPAWQAVTGSATRLMLLRHGQTPLSVDRRYSGRGNPELTDTGVAQAAAAAKRIDFMGGVDAIVSSPLVRARATADAVAAAVGVDVVIDEGLTETDFGAWEGMTFAEVSERDPELHKKWMADTSVAPPGGESFDAVRERIGEARDRLLQKYSGQTVVVVTHVTPIKTMLQFALDVGPSILYRMHLDLASLSIVDWFDDDRASVRLVNDTSYIWA
ncbi:bifunctional RNase H/acid phosphatase [Rhodococcoides trifolii]|uniref:Bifunctional RNase H/acid phosphatase n=1 Tax=Rhodococcoides trifolii TaxID=908250 RepID=A0A917FSP4_9NOCA|nr:bifunctional RNase H/acid phosphatase [Rhodococcus trifolii]GGG04864.1 bifunctional RNase H/acid phosphatase [Rhodococcus trifolii]